MDDLGFGEGFIEGLDWGDIYKIWYQNIQWSLFRKKGDPYALQWEKPMLVLL